jgi:hypothetical protein
MAEAKSTKNQLNPILKLVLDIGRWRCSSP